MPLCMLDDVNRAGDARIKATTRLLVLDFILFPAWFLGAVAAMLLDVPLSWPEAALTIAVLIGKTQTPF